MRAAPTGAADSPLSAWPQSDLLALARELGLDPAPSTPKLKLIDMIDPPKAPLSTDESTG